MAQGNDTLGEMVLRAIAKLVAVLVTIFVIWYEFPELSKNPRFLWLLMTWGIYGVIIFWLDYRKTKKITTNEKIDELIDFLKANLGGKDNGK